MAEPTHETDVIIIGAGPVGLFAVFELGLLDMRAHVVDVLEHPSGRLYLLEANSPCYFPQAEEYGADVAGALLEYLLSQREDAGPSDP